MPRHMKSPDSAALTQARLHEVLHYCPDTGNFTWLKTTRNVCPEKRVGSNQRGYVQIAVDKRTYRAHRLAFLYMEGRWPSEQVDHINGRRDDNRWSNLRATTHSGNMLNLQGPKKSNKLKTLGVVEKRGRYWATLTVRGRKVLNRGFPTLEEASAAYKAAKHSHV